MPRTSPQLEPSEPPADLAVPPMRNRVLQHVERFGRETVSFQVLEPGVQYWAHGDDALVAYTDTGRCWVAAGAPLCAPELYAEVSQAFIHAAAERGRRVVFCAAERPFVEASGLRSLRIGEQAAWDPRAWPQILRATRSLREQLRRARARGVVIRQLEPEELREHHPMRTSLNRVTHAWLASRRGPPLSFLLDVQLFSHAARRRVFVAEREGQGEAGPVGVLAAVPIYGRGGWFFEDVIRGEGAPNGTTELLIDAAMSACAADGCDHVTMGLVPLAGELPRWLRILRRLGTPFYDFGGLLRYRQKLRPHAWEPVELCFPEDQSSVGSAWDALCAVTHRNPVRHAVLALAGVRGGAAPASGSRAERAPALR